MENVRQLLALLFFSLNLFIANAQNSPWKVYSLEDELGFNPGGAVSILDDGLGNMWFGTPNGLIRLTDSTWSVYDISNSPLLVNHIWALQVDDESNLWIGTYGLEGGLAKFDGNEWRVWELDQYGIEGTTIYDIEIDTNGYLWMGTYWDGLVKFDGDTSFTIYNSENSGLPDFQEEINCVAVDDLNNIWYGSDAAGGGVFDQDSTWIIYTPGNSLIDWAIYSLSKFDDKSTWFGGVWYISILDSSGVWDTTSYPNTHWYVNILQHNQNSAFISSDTGLFKYIIDTKEWFYLYPQEYPELNGVWTWGLTKDRNGNLWIGYGNGYVAVVNPDSVVSVENEIEGNEIPLSYILYQNYPNPFNPSTKIKFTIPTSPLNPSPYQGEGHRERFITLKVYDVLGNEITSLVNEEKPAGNYEVEFSATGGATRLPSGVYFYQLRAGDFVKTKKMILLH